MYSTVVLYREPRARGGGWRGAVRCRSWGAADRCSAAQAKEDGVEMLGLSAPLRLLAAAAVLLGRGAGHPTFSGLNVWPKPREHSWPGEGRGPLRIEGLVARHDVDPSCGERIGAILNQTMAPLVTSRVHDTITNDRTWVPGAYSEVDALCPAASRCSDDGDCAGASVCLIDPTRGRPWNSTNLCNPLSNADIGCGCCDSVVVSLSSVAVTCDEQDLQDEGSEAYTLEVTEDAPGTAKVSIRASAEHGASPWSLSIVYNSRTGPAEPIWPPGFGRRGACSLRPFAADPMGRAPPARARAPQPRVAHRGSWLAWDALAAAHR
eukprot:COSAG02_NODE_1127_length_14428_cov_68.304627_14_plen_321_part_00